MARSATTFTALFKKRHIRIFREYAKNTNTPANAGVPFYLKTNGIPAFAGMRLLFFLIVFSLPAFAQSVTAVQKQGDDYLLSSDAIDYDQKKDVVVASGNVELTAPAQTLLGQQVSVDNINNVLAAPAPISIVDKDGNVFYAQEAQLSKDFRDGFAKNVAMRAQDNTLFAAAQARRYKGEATIFSKGVFSPCSLCKTDPRRPPLWQMRAERTTHDEVNKDYIHRDVTLEMWGTPVLYMPYFSHPDPTVKRRSGFLSPSIGNNSDIGTFVRVPYYYTFSPSLDYTVAPNFNGHDGMRYEGSLRKRFEKGTLLFNHSAAISDFTDDKGTAHKEAFRGHINGYFKYNIDNLWRAGTDFALQTDKNYLRTYNQSMDDVLVNRAYVEGFKARNYAALEGFYFQDNRPGTHPEQAIVLPRMRLSALGEPNATLGGRWSLDTMATALTRSTGSETRKFNVDAGWERRDVLPLGFVSTLAAHVRDDFFWVNNLTDPVFPTITHNNETTNRLNPEGQIKVEYPFANDYGAFTHVVTPTAALTASPTRALDPRIPNEDSIDTGLDTTNLFDLNRYPGADAVEQGTRVAYGIRNGFYANQGSYAEFNFGQSYRLTSDPLYPVGSGLEGDRSDYVGEAKIEILNLKYPSTLRFDYQFELDNNAHNFRRHDAHFVFGIPEFMPDITYTYLDPPPTWTTGTGAVEELRYGFTSTIYDYYTFKFSQIRDLRPGAVGVLSTSVGLGYADECFRASVTYTRDETSRTGVNSGDTVLFNIYFKHLGGIDSDKN